MTVTPARPGTAGDASGGTAPSVSDRAGILRHVVELLISKDDEVLGTDTFKCSGFPFRRVMSDPCQTEHIRGYRCKENRLLRLGTHTTQH